MAEFGNGAFGQLLKPIPEMFDHAFQSAEDLVAALVRPVPPEDERAWVPMLGALCHHRTLSNECAIRSWPHASLSAERLGWRR